MTTFVIVALRPFPKDLNSLMEIEKTLVNRFFKILIASADDSDLKNVNPTTTMNPVIRKRIKDSILLRIFVFLR
jgi:hypothetical protein